MNHLLKMFMPFIVLMISSCNQNKTTSRFSEGQCVLEELNNYASYVKQKGPIYKIESKKGQTFKVSIWYNNSWLYQGSRSVGYFRDRKKLVYKAMNCPDGRSKASITDKIKGIEL